MSRTEDRARDLGYGTDPLNRTEYTENEVWEGFIEGYHQAEQDLELKWEDVSKIKQIMFDYNRQLRPEIVENKASLPKDEEYCREVLNRFKKGKC